MKVCSIVLFVCMSSLIKLGGEGLATGQITFFRSFFAMFPILGWLAISGELKGAFRTANPVGHFYRGFIGVSSMALGFFGVVHLPLPEYIAIGYAQPLFAVVAGWLLLGEIVRRYRWSAVAAGFVGVVIILWPRLEAIRSGTLGLEGTMGAVAVLASAAISAIAMVHVRQLVRTENTPTIVLYFSLSSSCFSLLTLPFGWVAMTPVSAGLLILAGFFGGVGQILLTESYRYADVSAVAPFEYTSIIWGTISGYFLFSELPDQTLILGTAIVIGSGIFIIYRESRRTKEIVAGREREKITADA
jgi:drug/metabolite transporter (DMT)-like permease